MDNPGDPRETQVTWWGTQVTRWGTPRRPGPYLPAVTEVLDLLLQLRQRLDGLGLAQGQRLQLLLQPHHVVLVRQQAVPLRGHGGHRRGRPEVGPLGTAGDTSEQGYLGAVALGVGRDNHHGGTGCHWGHPKVVALDVFGDTPRWWHWMSPGTTQGGGTGHGQGHPGVVALDVTGDTPGRWHGSWAGTPQVGGTGCLRGHPGVVAQVMGRDTPSWWHWMSSGTIWGSGTGHRQGHPKLVALDVTGDNSGQWH